MKFRAIYKLGSRLLVSTVLLAACVENQLYLNNPDNPATSNGRVSIRIYTDADEFHRPLSKIVKENEIAGTMPWVFVFNNITGNFVEVEQASLAGTTPAIPHVLLTNTLNPVRIVIVANAPTTFRDGANMAVAFNKLNLTTAFSGTNYTGFIERFNTAAITDLNTIPYYEDYLPMVGETTLAGGVSNTITIGSNDSKIALTRIVAKVTINNTAAGFILDSWNVIKTRNSTALYTGNLPDPSASALINFNEGIASSASTFYLYPSQSSDNTTIIVKGSIDGGMNYYYYPLLFRNNGASASSIAVEQNKHYTFNIAGVERLGYNTYTDAVAAVAGISNNLPSVSYKIAVTDISTHDIKDNGTFYLGMSNSRVIFYDVPITLPYTVATVSTDATAAMLVSERNTIAITDINPPESLTASVSPSSLTLGGQTNITISGMTSDFRSAKIVITLGDIVQEMELYKMMLAGITNAPGGIPMVHDLSGNYYTSAEVINEFGNPWLFVCTDALGTNMTTRYDLPLGITDYLYLYVLANTEPLPRDGEILLSHKTAGHVKVYVKQIGT